jgi:hypothetical protein
LIVGTVTTTLAVSNTLEDGVATYPAKPGDLLAALAVEAIAREGKTEIAATDIAATTTKNTPIRGLGWGSRRKKRRNFVIYDFLPIAGD